MLINADLGALEWVTAAGLCQDQVMIQEILDGVDIHTANSIAIFGDASYRQESKVISFRALYGGSAYAFFMDVNMPTLSLERWEEIHKAFYNKYKQLGAWQNQLYKLVCKQGWYQSPTGRRYSFSKKVKPDGSSVYNKPNVCNYIVQGTATGDFVPLVLLITRKLILSKNISAKIIGQVHDSIIIECQRKDVDMCSEIVYSVFRQLDSYVRNYFQIPWNVPFTGEVEVGNNYKQMYKLFNKIGRVAYLHEIGELQDGKNESEQD